LGRPIVRNTAPALQSATGVRPAAFMEPAAFPRGADPDVAWTDAAEPTEAASEFAMDRAEPAASTASDPIDLRLTGLAPTNAGQSPAPAGAAPAMLTGVNESAPVLGSAADGDVEFPKFYVSAEYLLWWLKQDKVPVLASTSSNPFDNGELGKPTTQVLFGGGGLDGGGRSGVRVTGGWWLDETCRDDAIEVSGFYLGQKNTSFDASSSQFPVLARPFFDVLNNAESAQLTAFPGVLTGNIDIKDKSNFFGAEVNGRCKICSGCNYRFDVFGGFRYLELDESLAVTESGLFLAGEGPPLAGDTFVGRDFFSTQNQFYGGQVGLIGEYDWRRFSLEGRMQVALGDTHQSVLIDGDQIITSPGGATQRFLGDLLALNSNIGRHSRDRFGVVPEINLNVGYQLTDHIRIYLGYDALYWNSVVRPGAQIDRRIDITQIPNFLVQGAPGVFAGQTVPAPQHNGTDFWAQGATAGVEIRY
jgi:hypothetical protein